MDTHQTHPNLQSVGGENSCNEASGSPTGQGCHEATNSNKSNLCEGFGGPVACFGNSHSSQTQADSLEISVASQLSVADKHRKMDYNLSISSDGNLTINDLPDELLLAIFSYTSFPELLNVIPHVCSRWETLSRDAEVWHDKVYNVGFRESHEEIVQTLKMMPQLRTLVVPMSVDPSVLQVLCENCHQLTTLDIDLDQPVGDSELKNIVKMCTKIHTLKTPAWELDVENVLKLSHLRVLQLKGDFYDDCGAWLIALADRCPQLCDLDVKDTYYKIQDIEYFLNAKRHTLKRICVKWTSTSGRFVGPLLTVCANSLEHLVLCGYDSYPGEGEEEACAALGKLHKLQVLNLRTVLDGLRGALPLLFKSGGLSSLKKLKFKEYFCAMDETIIAVSRGCPQLRELTLQDCKRLTDAAFMDIHHLKQLEIFSFHYFEDLGGATIACIARLPALHTLRFDNVEFERFQPGLEHILDMSGLRCLYLRFSSTQQVPFDRFPGRLVNLRELHLQFCDYNQHILDEICKQMPKLKVYRKP